MVSTRCKMVVKAELEKLGIVYNYVELGQVDLPENLSSTEKQALSALLLSSGLELMEDKKAVLIEKIKQVIVELVHYSEEPLEVNFSEHLSKKLSYDYTYLSNLFSETEGTTIERYLMIHKIERVKELIIYNELNLTEIAWKMNYSSVAHLSHQFKKITGLTPSFFKAIKDKKRTGLDNV
jgi:AraC-like DNA-binding protein